MIEKNVEHYNFKKYSKLYRWCDYWCQIHEIYKLQPTSVLEVGMGEGIVGYYLKHHLMMKYVVVDLDARLKPDIVGDVLSLPLPDATFDMACSFEVLEHLPFEKFLSALQELKRVSKKYVIISLPHWGLDCCIDIRLPLNVFGRKRIRWLHKFSMFRPQHELSGHQWEIGKRDYSIERVRSEILRCELKIIEDFVFFESPYHHYFILEH